MKITLRYPAKCRDCGAHLEVGTEARWYGRGRVYGIECHDRDGNPLPGFTRDNRDSQAEPERAAIDYQSGRDAQPEMDGSTGASVVPETRETARVNDADFSQYLS